MNCDLIAPHYWWIERLGMGRALERRRRWFLPELGNARRALLLGEGDGRFLRELKTRNSAVRIDYVDLSREMLRQARRAAGNHRVRYHFADVLRFQLPERAFDLIATHFFFDCFDAGELDLLIRRVADAAKPGAQWVVSEFCTPNIAAAVLVRGLYLFFRITTGLRTRRLVDHRPILRSYGFRLVNERHSLGALVVSELWER